MPLRGEALIGISGRALMNGLDKKRQERDDLFPPFEYSARRQPPTNQGEGNHQIPNLLAP